MENIIIKKTLKTPVNKVDIFKYVSLIITSLFIICIITIIMSMFIKTNIQSLLNIINEKDSFLALKTTLASILISMPLVILIGTILAYTLSNKKGVLYKLFEVIICIPVILPPSVAGIALLSTFGRNGIIGKILNNYSINTTFSFISIVIVQVFITLPFYYQVVKASFDNIDKSIIESAKVFGANSLNLILKVYVPISIKGILAGVILSSLRAISEFGATIMFAGNMVGKTQTLTTRIYYLYQTNTTAAITLAAVQLLIFLIPFIFVKLKLDY